MPALSDLPELIGFFSYSREDDEDFDHSLSKLRTRIQNELRGQLGRSRESLRLWQDREAIPPGTLWASEIQAAIGQSVFFIPIVSPRVVRSGYCGIEFREFLERERQLRRRDLVFPILFINVPELTGEKAGDEHPVLDVIAERQYVDWREFRYDPDSPAVRRQVADFCEKIATTLRRTPPQDEDEKRRAYEAEQVRRKQTEDDARGEAARRREAAEAEARAKAAEDRQRAEGVARSQREAADERLAQAAQVPPVDTPSPTPRRPEPATMPDAGQRPPELPGKQPPSVAAIMLAVVAGIECVLTAIFLIQHTDMHFGEKSLVAGLLALDIATAAIGIGAIRGRAWAIPLGLAIGPIGLANGLLWIVWLATAEKSKIDATYFIAWPHAIASIAYVAGILSFRRLLLDRKRETAP
jgi:hypothetical protein